MQGARPGAFCVDSEAQNRYGLVMVDTDGINGMTGASAFPKQITDSSGVTYARTGRTKLSESSGRVIAEYQTQTGATLWASVHGLVTAR